MTDIDNLHVVKVAEEGDYGLLVNQTGFMDSGVVLSTVDGAISFIVAPFSSFLPKRAYLGIVGSYGSIVPISRTDNLYTDPQFSEIYEISGLDELFILRNLDVITDMIRLYYRSTNEDGYIEQGVHYGTLSVVDSDMPKANATYYSAAGSALVRPDRFKL